VEVHRRCVVPIARARLTYQQLMRVHEIAYL
jgi:hypothetical protein